MPKLGYGVGGGGGGDWVQITAIVPGPTTFQLHNWKQLLRARKNIIDFVFILVWPRS
jgi:hypothetical protein